MNQIKDIVLEGHLIEEVSLYGELNPTVTLVGEMSLPVDYDSYDNSYIVTPSVDSQILYTDDKKNDR